MNRLQSLQSPARRAFMGFALAGAVALTGCATATGPAFTQVQATPDGKAQLYLYRKSALYAIGAAYPVTNISSNEKLGALVNASYLLVPLTPGKHFISVDERGFTSAKTFEILAEAGKSYFVEYDSSKGLLLGWGLLSGGAVKTQEQALVDLKELKRAN